MNTIREFQFHSSPLKIGSLLAILFVILGISLIWAFNGTGTNVAAADPAAQQILEVSGRLDFLRVHDRGGYGPDNDRLNGHVVFSFQNDNRAFGFALGTGSDQNNHKAMFDLLLTAYLNGLVVTTDYQDDGGRNNTAIRVWLGG